MAFSFKFNFLNVLCIELWGYRDFLKICSCITTFHVKTLIGLPVLTNNLQSGRIYIGERPVKRMFWFNQPKMLVAVH